MKTETFKEYAGIKVLDCFAVEPHKEFYLREVAKACHVSPSTAKRFLDMFSKEGRIGYGEKKNRASMNFLVNTKKANIRLFRANLENPVFRQYKAFRDIEWITKTGIIEYIIKALNPLSVVLFGSFARGEGDSESDLDLLIIRGTKEAELNFREYADKSRIDVNAIIYDLYEWEQKARKDKAFYEGVLMDGIALYGEVPVI